MKDYIVRKIAFIFSGIIFIILMGIKFTPLTIILGIANVTILLVSIMGDDIFEKGECDIEIEAS